MHPGQWFLQTYVVNIQKLKVSGAFFSSMTYILIFSTLSMVQAYIFMAYSMLG
jgi:hypothetical protein